MYRALLTSAGALALALAAGCATAGGGGGDDDDDIIGTDGSPGGPDGSTQGTPDARPGTPDAPPGTPVQITITHSTATTITAGNSVACVAQDPVTMAPLYHREGGYYRVFDLSSFGINSAFNVSQVTVGIETATAGAGGSQPANIKLYTLSGALTVGNLSLIGSQATTVTDTTTGVTLDVPVTGTAPAGSTLVVELQTPDGEPGNDLLFPGSNASGQSGPTYLRAPDCGATDPADVGTLGFPDMHFVMSVTGTHTP